MRKILFFFIILFFSSTTILIAYTAKNKSTYLSHSFINNDKSASYQKFLRRIETNLKQFQNVSNSYAPHNNPSELPYGGDIDTTIIPKPWSNLDIIFKNKANFYGITFSNEFNLYNAKFYIKPHFNSSIFKKSAYFINCSFFEEADFSKVQFKKNIEFSYTTFLKSTSFEGTHFNEKADFQNVKFIDNANFKSSYFIEDAIFDNTQFRTSADFRNVQFAGNINFENCDLTNKVVFTGTRFEQGIDFRRADLSKVDTISFDHHTFFPNGKLIINWKQLKNRIYLDSLSCKNLPSSLSDKQ